MVWHWTSTKLLRESTWNTQRVQTSAHRGLLTPYGDLDLCEHWLSHQWVKVSLLEINELMVSDVRIKRSLNNAHLPAPGNTRVNKTQPPPLMDIWWGLPHYHSLQLGLPHYHSLLLTLFYGCFLWFTWDWSSHAWMTLEIQGLAILTHL